MMALSKIRLTVIVGLMAGTLGSSSLADTAVNLDSGSVFRDCADCPEMVVVPPGAFAMGFDGGEQDRFEGPVRQVQIAAGFAAGRFPVTNAEYARFIDDSGHQSGRGCRYWDTERGEMRQSSDNNWRDPGHGRPIRDNEPVVCVSWVDSKAYARWLSVQTSQAYGLLTEAQWEYLARDGASTLYPWGDDPAQACKFANVGDHAARQAVGQSTAWPHADCDDGFVSLAPVDAFPANGFGVFDLIGNSWEWVEDCYLVPYPALPVDGSAVQAEGPCDRRSVRGGSWITKPFRQRPSWRGRDPENHLSFIFGFRVARDLP